MSYSTAVRREIYLSWKPIFSRANNSQIRKRSKIQDIVNDYAPMSHRFWHPNLINILKDLLEGHVFSSDYCAAQAFPDLFHDPKPKADQKTISKPAQLTFREDECDEPTRELMSSLKELYYSGEYSDLTISCGQSRYRVHKALVCPQSDFFIAACGAGFKETREGIVDLPDDDPWAVKMMIHYFYHFEYDTQSIWEFPQNSSEATHASLSEASQMPSSLVLHAKIYALAEKYNICGLKDFALQEFKAAAIEHWATPGFLDAAREAYISTIEADRGLRDVVVTTFHQHSELLNLEETLSVLKESGMLAVV
ncbi:hypothetical protein FHL15_008066 [Xylaria flabelliformis]|uniref:BTB domain-containing protein n=1 Tax=Xylaria flabelliformis TaxID=2512241 RepID=A0A553HT24_9PEZI|nr:hypothetical protein FHL15_008066 [Xylaria flabelliformis]